MVAPDLLRPVAEALKLFGNNGTLIVKFRPRVLTYFKETEPVFAIMEGIPVPFFVATLQIRGNDRAHLLFDAIYSEAQARELVGKTLYQSAPKRNPKKGEQQRFENPAFLIGFTASDLKMGALGIVVGFMDWKMNPCLSIAHANGTGTFLVPFQEPFIVGIDAEKREISLSLPEGLIELG